MLIQIKIKGLGAITKEFKILIMKQAKPILKKGDIEVVVDPRLEGAYDVTELKRIALAASLCIRASSTWRPSMSEVAT